MPPRSAAGWFPAQIQLSALRDDGFRVALPLSDAAPEGARGFLEIPLAPHSAYALPLTFRGANALPAGHYRFVISYAESPLPRVGAGSRSDFPHWQGALESNAIDRMIP